MSRRLKRPRLAARYGAPPFSVLDARQGYWQNRKRQWRRLGLRSYLGRRADMNTMVHITPGTCEAMLEKAKNFDGVSTSIFDPTLCELIYRWFCPPGGLVVDPFAGGSVRGVVAALLGRRYVGVELRPEQVEANRRQWREIKPRGSAYPTPRWIVGDARNILQLCGGVEADMVFSCPPYHDLERYSDDPRDLSAMPYLEFLRVYRRIIIDSLQLLRPDRFGCFVVANIRDRKGIYRNLVGQTIAAFRAGGARLYNDAVLVTPVGTLAMRAERPFRATRKLAKGHQNVLVFVKGAPSRATKALGEVEAEIDLGGESHE